MLRGYLFLNPEGVRHPSPGHRPGKKNNIEMSPERAIHKKKDATVIVENNGTRRILFRDQAKNIIPQGATWDEIVHPFKG